MSNLPLPSLTVKYKILCSNDSFILIYSSIYVLDLTHVFVQSAEEAYKVMYYGRNNLKFASNNLNKSSSRSHCIFTLKLMRVENVENPKTAVISRLNLFLLILIFKVLCT